ncbi:DUF221-domain-containing protein [Acaromyces ingoldii]|uniref:DUF221-domain-containing protein n=1 Tax=Acaromyces ingoldii TaxID=215250 RepID=A0A316YHW1_9BASI|nr:DUF221-domain-containing protein [Acaromyces ingoldii]PWN88656.1 DUF221-domain-containing protein [Acaromyces ingoldii]
MQTPFTSLGDGEGGGEVPPWQPQGRRFEGPWLQQQLVLSASIGLISFLVFSLVRRRSPALFAPRTKLKGFTPHTKGVDDGIFSWIGPTLRTEDVKILHIVGLDAAIILSFFKMAFWIFFFLTVWSCAVVMPVNYSNHGSIDGVAPSEEPRRLPDDGGGDKDGHDGHGKGFMSFGLPTNPDVPWSWSFPTSSPYHITHLATVYLFTAIILRALWKGSHKFIRSRQLYALELLQSIPARTVEVRNLPPHLQRERDLAEYFEGFGLKVESTAVVRETAGLKELLAKRTNTLYQLERTWCRWLGNPTNATNYDPERIMRAVEQKQDYSLVALHRAAAAAPSSDVEAEPLLSGTGRDQEDNDDEDDDGTKSIRAPQGRQRPTVRLQPWNPFSTKVDAIHLLETRFKLLDRDVKRLRSKGAVPSSVGFVTFVDAMSAQVAAQTVHYPLPLYCETNLAPEPRDIIWSNVSLTPNERRVRQVLVSSFTFALFVFYIPPLAFIASFLSPRTIKKYLPALYDLLKRDDRLMAIASTSLPSIVVISFNAVLPLILEWTAHLQGLKARSLVEFSVLKRYHIFLVTSVIFVFLVTQTALTVLADLANNPMKIIDKLAESLPGARHFSLSYVVFQALAILPLQLLQLPVVIGRAFGRLVWARTPREHAELNAPPQLYAGSVYPAALIVFTLCIVYSIVSPLITVFGAIYFGLAYVVYKHKLLFVFYKAYESRGQAWPLSTSRCIWALLLFQLFQLSLFSVRKQLLLSALTLPLLAFTAWFGSFLDSTFRPLSEYVNVSSIAEVDRGASLDADSSTAKDKSGRAARKDNPLLVLRDDSTRSLDPSQTILSRKRYAAQDETLFVAQRDRHTNYREPPMGGYFFGTLNTGRRRYGHPAITGMLPELWLPIPVDEDEEKDTESQPQQQQQQQQQRRVATTSSAPMTSTTTTATATAHLFGDEAQHHEQPHANSPSSLAPSPSSLVLNGSRLRKTSRPNEALVISLRRRKSSILKRSTASSSIGDGAVPSSSSLALRGKTLPKGGAGAWDEGPRGTPHTTSLGEALAGSEASDPIRASTSTSFAVSAPKEVDQPDALQGAEAGSLELDDEEEEEEDEGEEGVYMHRAARGHFPGSFPGGPSSLQDDDDDV